jgi:hypothetical protein
MACMRTFVAAAVAALWLAPSGAAALDDGPPRRGWGEVRPAFCWNLDLKKHERSPTVEGPVDGDRHPDTIVAEVDWLDRRTCRVELVVSTRKGTFRTPVEAAPGGTLLAPPGLLGLVELDRRRGAEIVLLVEAGASTGLVRVYGLQGRSLAALSPVLFGYAGSVMNRSGVDCTRKRGAVLVSSSATFADASRRYRVVRSFYGLRAGQLRPLPALTERRSVRERGLARFPELARDAPFPSCTVVR